MKKKFSIKIVLFVLIPFVFISCDKDFTEIGAEFVDSDHYSFTSDNSSEIKAFTKDLGAVQTSNLPINALGYYNNPVFGKVKASFVTQLELETVDPKFYNVTEVDSVYLHVPYFSTLESTDSEGNGTYTLDSIYGSGKIDLKVYRNGYFLRNLDPDTQLQEQQRYYSNQKAIFDGAIVGSELNNSPDTKQNADFEFKETQIKFYKTNPDNSLTTTVRQRLAPGIYMDLNKAAFFSAIMGAPAGKLENNTVFKDYFRGLYFQVNSHSSNPNGAALSMLNFAQGKIVIVYKGTDSGAATDTTKKRKTLVLNLRGNTVNVLENTNSAVYSSGLTASNATTGDEKLYLKGGEGSMAVIELFGGQKYDASKILQMRSEKWLINEANLVFNIDNDIMSNPSNLAPEPNRIYLYDLNNNRPLVDYYYDSSTGANSAKYNKSIHGGIIKKVSDRGTQYKIRITNHIRNLIKYSDSTNVRLGLVVTENIGNVGNVKIKTPFTTGSGSYITSNKYVPSMNVANPLGTILYGTHPSAPADKRLKLEINYTKPD